MSASQRAESRNAPLGDQGKVARDVLESLLEGCQVIGFDFRYLYVNATVAAQGQRSKEQLIGRTMMECYPGIENTPVFFALRRCMSDRTHHSMENEFTFPDGSIGWFELRLVPVPEGTCILSMDITERKRAQLALAKSEEQLRHAQKMEAIGRLAGGVAHDFNNMLSVIISYSGLAMDSLKPNDPTRADVQEIQNAGYRAAELTKQLLAFSRQQVTQAKIIDLNESVAGIDKMLRRLIGDDVELRTVATPRLGRVKADPGHIDQILMNLAVNARDAMPAGGQLTIETGNVELDDAYARDHLGTEPGPHVMLAVSDTGSGMDKETLRHIFEPFFTTKPVGKGTGLGLSTVFGIVQQSEGSIWVYSEPGKGTTFKVYFPCVEETEVPGVVRRTPMSTRVVTPRGKETILLVEDDAQLRHLILGLLERGGYNVLVAPTPEEALHVTADIDLLLTDVIMPGMDGRELARRFLIKQPETRVLYMSGYTGDAIVHHRVLDDGAAFLQKPITPTALALALQEIFEHHE